ncbi:hypothetical protein [Paraburkholderia aspalathi]|uniref:hypothetical protein n=2 Tax=Paraburkholderia aspalathi TaxID=1324617 RepID=UPI0038B9C1FE
MVAMSSSGMAAARISELTLLNASQLFEQKIPLRQRYSPGQVMIKLSEKYIHAIREFVQTIDYEDWYQTQQADHPYTRLVKIVSKLHSDFMDEGNVHHMIQTVVARFMGADGRVERTGLVAKSETSEDAELLVGLIKTEIEAYPCEYELRIELPSAQIFGEFKLELAPGIHLICNPYNFSPYGGKNEALARALIQSSDKNSTYLLIEASGYGDWNTDTPMARGALARARQASFILATYGVTERAWYSEKIARCSLTERASGGRWQLELPQAIAACFSDLTFKLTQLTIYEKKGLSILNVKERPAETDAERVSALTRIVQPVGRYFASAGHCDHPSVAAAIEWYQDSIYADNQTFAYLAACIGLEALLAGNDHLDSMTSRLIDRYSFLLGAGRKERQSLADEYSNVLKVRGKLVHAKQSRLTGEDKRYLDKVQAMLLRVIWRELQSIYQSSQDAIGTSIK